MQKSRIAGDSWLPRTNLLDEPGEVTVFYEDTGQGQLHPEWQQLEIEAPYRMAQTPCFKPAAYR